jgi:hypothetical protein
LSAIVLLDTSVYLNVLDVDGFNQDRSMVLAEFKRKIEDEDSFLLPMATIWETGNHIAHLPDGGGRRRFASALVQDVRSALTGETPYRPTHFPEREEFLSWLDSFPDFAQRSKSARKPNEGGSLADLSIIKEWDRTCRLHAMSRVLIWALDSDLMGYDRNPT